MKLHLPCALRGALMACFALACTAPTWAATLPSTTEVGRLKIYDGAPPVEPDISFAEFKTDETTANVLSPITSQIECNNYDGDYSWKIRVAGVITRSEDTTKDIIILTNVEKEKTFGDTFDLSNDLKKGQFALVLTQAGELILYNNDKCSRDEESEKGTMATYWVVGNLGDTDWTMMRFNFVLNATSMGEGAYQAMVLNANPDNDSTTVPQSYLYLYDEAGNQLLTNVTATGNDRDVLQYGWANMGGTIDKADLNNGMYTRLPENSYLSLYNLHTGAPETLDDLPFPIATKQPLAVNWYLVNGSSTTVEDLRNGTYKDFTSGEGTPMLDSETLVFCGGELATDDYTKVTTVTVNNPLNVQDATTDVKLTPGDNATMVITNGEQALNPALLAYDTDGKEIAANATATYAGKLIIGGGTNSKVVLQNVTTPELKNTTVQAGAGLELAGDASSTFTIDLNNATLSIDSTASLGVSGGSTLELKAKTDGSSTLGSLTGDKGLIRLYNALTTTTVNTDGLTITENATLTVSGDNDGDTTDFSAGAVTLEKGTTLTVKGTTSAGNITVGEDATVEFNAMASTGAIKVGKNATLTSTSFISNKGITTEEGATVTVNGSINAGTQNIILGKSSSMTSNTSTINVGTLILMEGTDDAKTTASSQSIYSQKGDLIVNNNAAVTTTDYIMLLNGNIVVAGAAGSVDAKGAVTSTGVQLSNGGTLTIDPTTGSLSTTGASSIDGGQIVYGDLLIEAATAGTAAEFTALKAKGNDVSATSVSDASIELTAAGDCSISLGAASNTTIANTSGNMEMANTVLSKSTLTVTDGNLTVSNSAITSNSTVTVGGSAITLNDSAIGAGTTVEVTGANATASFGGNSGLTLEDGASITVGGSQFSATNAQNGVSLTGSVENGVLTVNSLTANIRHLDDLNNMDEDGYAFILHDANGSIADTTVTTNFIYAPGMAGDIVKDKDGHLSILLRDDSEKILTELRTSENASQGIEGLAQGRKVSSGGSDDIIKALYDDIRDTSLRSPEERQAIIDQYASGSITMLADSQRHSVTNTINKLRNRIIQMGNQHDIEHENNVHAWISGDGANNDVDQDGSFAGYEYQSWGGTVGAHVDSGNFSFGAAVSASYGDMTSHASDMAEGDHDTVTLSGFVRHQSGNWTQMGILSLGRNEVEMSRKVGSYEAEGDASGHTITAYYEAGYTFVLGESGSQVLQPLVSVSLTSARMGGLTETGSIGNAGYCTDTEDYFYGTVGVGARYQVVLGQDVHERLSFLELRAKVVQDFGDETNELATTLVGAPGAGFTVKGADVGRTGFQFGAGLSVPMGIYTTFFADVDADIRSGATSYGGSVGVRIEF